MSQIQSALTGANSTDIAGDILLGISAAQLILQTIKQLSADSAAGISPAQQQANLAAAVQNANTMTAKWLADIQARGVTPAGT